VPGLISKPDARRPAGHAAKRRQDGTAGRCRSPEHCPLAHVRRASRGCLFRFEQIEVAAKHMITTTKAAEVELHAGDRADQSIEHATA
jgi:hypothetical protein